MCNQLSPGGIALVY
jgi:hypothetical protein